MDFINKKKMSKDTWTKTKFEKFKKAYKLAVKEKKEYFMYEDGEWLTDYAKQMVEFLQPRFNFK